MARRAKLVPTADPSADFPDVPMSPLEARYNGSMLGLFFVGAHAKYVGGRYPQLRDRMDEYLRELGLDVRLPRTRREFVRDHEQLAAEIAMPVAARAPVVADFMLIAVYAFFAATQRDVDEEGAAQMRTMCRRALEKHGLDVRPLDTLLATVRPQDDGFLPGDPLHTALLEFVRSLITPLPADEDTAFVVMPFLQPTRFAELYAPVLRRLRKRAVRAWGGFGLEDYQPLLDTLIFRSGVVLADLTGLNPNVLIEVGIAWGRRDGALLLLCDARQKELPSNLGDLVIHRYDPRRRGWQERAIDEGAAVFSMALVGLALERGEIEPIEGPFKVGDVFDRYERQTKAASGAAGRRRPRTRGKA